MSIEFQVYATSGAHVISICSASILYSDLISLLRAKPHPKSIACAVPVVRASTDPAASSFFIVSLKV